MRVELQADLQHGGGASGISGFGPERSGAEEVGRLGSFYGAKLGFGGLGGFLKFAEKDQCRDETIVQVR